MVSETVAALFEFVVLFYTAEGISPTWQQLPLRVCCRWVVGGATVVVARNVHGGVADMVLMVVVSASLNALRHLTGWLELAVLAYQPRCCTSLTGLAFPGRAEEEPGTAGIESNGV